MKLQEKLGSKIRELRKRRKITQASLAEKTDLSDNFIGLLERGKTSPSLESLEKIARALKVPVRELFEFETDEPNKARLLAELNKKLKQKNKEDINWFYKISALLLEKM